MIQLTFSGTVLKIKVLSIFLCEIIFCQFLEERQVLGNFPYGF